MSCEVKIRSSDGSTQIVDSALEELEQALRNFDQNRRPLNKLKYLLKHKNIH